MPLMSPAQQTAFDGANGSGHSAADAHPGIGADCSDVGVARPGRDQCLPAPQDSRGQDPGGRRQGCPRGIHRDGHYGRRQHRGEPERT